MQKCSAKQKWRLHKRATLRESIRKLRRANKKKEGKALEHVICEWLAQHEATKVQLTCTFAKKTLPNRDMPRTCALGSKSRKHVEECPIKGSEYSDGQARGPSAVASQTMLSIQRVRLITLKALRKCR